MKLGCKCEKHKGQAAINYANQPVCPLLPCRAFFVIIKLCIIFGNLRLKLYCSPLSSHSRGMLMFSGSWYCSPLLKCLENITIKEVFIGRVGSRSHCMWPSVSISSTICPIISTKIQSWSRLVGPRRGTRTLCVRWWPDGLSSLDWWW